MPLDLLRDLETHLALGLRADAARVEVAESTARVLLVLQEQEAVPMTEVARRVGRDPTTATRFVDRAAGAGLLTRARGAQDRRRRLARLTDMGVDARRRLQALRERRAAALLQSILAATGLGEGQVEWFLQAFVEGLGSASPSGAPRD